MLRARGNTAVLGTLAVATACVSVSVAHAQAGEAVLEGPFEMIGVVTKDNIPDNRLRVGSEIEREWVFSGCNAPGCSRVTVARATGNPSLALRESLTRVAPGVYRGSARHGSARGRLRFKCGRRVGSRLFRITVRVSDQANQSEGLGATRITASLSGRQGRCQEVYSFNGAAPTAPRRSSGA
jgi:hypothetical protein